MRSVFFSVAMLVGLTASSQEFMNPVVVKSYSKVTEKHIWYTFKDDISTKMMIGDNDAMADYYVSTVSALEFDPTSPTREEGVVKIWEDDIYIVRVSLSTHTVIEVTSK